MRLTGLLAITLFFISCVKDKPVPIQNTSIQLSNQGKVFVINEGNFGSGNAGISVYDPASGNVVEDIYKNSNGNYIGDVAQSISKINGDYYVVVNNSGKIAVCDDQFKLKRVITGFTSPRYIQQVSNQKIYVSDLYANAVSIVDLNSGSITGSISIPGWTEKMVMLYNKVFVACPNRNHIYVIDASSNALIDSIYLTHNTSEIVLDNKDQIIFLASSGTSEDGMMGILDPITKTITEGIITGGSPSPRSLCLNVSKDTAYFIGLNIASVPLNKISYWNQNFIPKGNKNFYGLGVNPKTGELYVSDALDYVQKSNIYVYNHSGVQLSSFKSGINSNGFFFE